MTEKLREVDKILASTTVTSRFQWLLRTNAPHGAMETVNRSKKVALAILGGPIIAKSGTWLRI